MIHLLSQVFDTQFLASAVRMTTPILLAAMGGLLCSLSGTLNVALEGLMLMGAFGAVAGSFYTGSWLAGVGLAVLLGTLTSVLLSVTIIKYKANELVVGLAVNLAALGATTFMMRTLWQVKGSFIDPRIAPLPSWRLPLIHHTPVLGKVLSGHTPVVYASWAVVLIINYVIYHTAFGLRLRATGENARAAETLGVRTKKLQYVAFILSGALSGLAGAQLSLGLVTLFLINMTAGRGFVAMVAVILGQRLVAGVAGASLLFGLAEGLTMRLQGLRIPPQFVLMLPYLITIITMVLLRPRHPRPVLPEEARKAALEETP